MQAIRRTLPKVAASSTPVLITGETGAGKEVLAKQIHLLSPWRDGPLCRVCSPLVRGSLGKNDPLGESIIALAYPPNWQAAEGSPLRTTLFLNEIALLDPALQLGLIEKLEPGPLLRIALPENLSLELRVVCDTSRQLEEEVRAGTFLRELYYAIRVVTIELPPLRQRAGDIPQLTRYFLDYYNRRFQTQTPPPSARIMRLMSDYHWPGNVRELENLIMRYVVQGSESAFTGELGSRHSGLPSSETLAPGAASMKEAARQAVHELERQVIRTILERHHWNRKQAARALNISYRSLLYKIKAAGIPPKRTPREEVRPPAQGESAPHSGGKRPEDTVA